MRRRCPASAASSSTSSVMEDDEERREETPSTTTSTMTSPEAPRRVPPLPEEYEEEEVERRQSPSPTPSRFALPSLRRASLLVLPLLLQLLQPAAAVPCGPTLPDCDCSHDMSHIKCAPGAFTTFPYILPLHVTHLDLSGSKLIFPDFSVDSYIPNVHTLILRNCSLQSLQGDFLSGLTALRKVDLSDNDIRDVDGEAFSGVQGLEHLVLSGNRRLSLPLHAFDRLETLRTLDLSECGLKEMEQGVFDGLKHLEELRLKKNRLSALPRDLFRELRMLRELDLEDNKLMTIHALEHSESSLPHLHRLNLRGNLIKQLNKMDHLAQLTRLDVSRNQIVTLPALFPPSLHWLDLSFNELRSLATAAFDTLPELRHLDLSNNRNLREAKINVFVSLSSLEYLSLAHCPQLETFGPAQFQPLPLTLRLLNFTDSNGLTCDDCKLRSFPITVELHGHCTDVEKNELVLLSSLASCESLFNQAAVLIGMGAAVVVLVLILVLLIVCCSSSGRKESRPVTPITAKHASYGYGGHRKLKGKHSSLSPPLLASSSSSSTSPSGRDVGVYEARLGAGPLGGGIIYGAGGYLDWEGPITMMGYGGGGGGSSSGNSSGRSDYSEIPAYTQNRYCVPKSTVARAFSGAPLGAPGTPGTPRLPQTPPPSSHPQGMFPHTSGTLYPPPKYSPPPPPAGYMQQLQQLQHEQQPQLLLQTPLALQQQLQQQHAAAAIQPPCAYSPLTRL